MSDEKPDIEAADSVPEDRAQRDSFGGERAQVDERERRLLGELVKKAVSTGINTMLSTEEGVRAVVGAVAQKDIIGSAVHGVDATHKEAMSIVGREVGNFLENLNLSEEIAKILTSVSFEIRTEVRFIPNEDGKLRAKVSGGAKPKVKIRSEPSDDGATDEADDAYDADDELITDSALPESTRKMATRAVRGIVERFAEATAATARAAAEVAADAAVEVVNEARRGTNGDQADLNSGDSEG